MRETTETLMEDICRIAGVPVVEPLAGATEPKSFYVAVAEALGVRTTDAAGRFLTKPELAQAIVAAAHLPWRPEWDGSLTNSGGGGSITNDGLRQIREAASVLRRGRSR